MKIFNLFTACATTFLAQTAVAQVSVPGSHAPLSIAFPFSTEQLPPMDNAVLLAAEDASDGGFHFATPVDVSFNAEQHGTWHTLEDGSRVWRLEIYSPSATSLSVSFSRFHLPPGSELFVVGQDATIGAFTAEKNNRPHMEFITQPLDGDRILLEYYEPAGTVFSPILEIDTVAHGYKDLRTNEAGRCNVDVVCPVGKDWRKQADSVAVMMTDRNSKYCSGSMLNNALNDGRQLFLTAKHCVRSAADSRRHILGFKYESRVCNQRGDRQEMKTAQGLKLLAHFVESDFALFEVEEEIPDAYEVFLNGWNASRDPLTGAVGIHHPSTDVKKISFFNGQLTKSCWGRGTCQRETHWKVQPWSLGTTEPGSSGSPLFDKNKRVIGQLHGGSASCFMGTETSPVSVGSPLMSGPDGYDVYGGIFESYNSTRSTTGALAPSLNPTRLNINSMDGIYLRDARLLNKNKESTSNMFGNTALFSADAPAPLK